MQRRVRGESAFTLIELLVVTSVIGVMSHLSIQIYDMYKVRTYNSMTDTLMQNTRTALEAGRVDGVLTNPPGWRFVQITRPGPLQIASHRAFLPGLQNQKDMVVWAERNGRCEMGLMGDWCITEWLDTIHCKGSVWKSRLRFRNGTEMKWEWGFAGGWPCPNS